MEENNSIMGDILKKQIKELNLQKDKLIESRLKEMGVDVNEVLQERRFPLIISEKNDNGKETIYYNDGSKYGKRVITFYPCQIDDKDNSIILKIVYHK